MNFDTIWGIEEGVTYPYLRWQYAPKIISFAPPSPVNDTVCSWRTFNVTVNREANVSWYLNNSLLHTNESKREANYTLHAEFVGDNNVSAVAKNANGTDMQTWVWNVTAAPEPKINISKTVSTNGDCPGSDPLTVHIGDTVTCCFNVSNTGDVNLTGVTVNDNIYGPVTLGNRTTRPACPPHCVQCLPNGQCVKCEEGYDLKDGICVAIAPAPDIAVVKTASLTGTCPGSDPLAVSIGDTVTYCFNVTNTGDVNLTGVSVIDNIYGSVTLANTTLAPGETTGGTKTHIVVESDAPSVTNTATATGTDPLGGTVTNTDDCTIDVTIGPEIEVAKAASLTGTCPGSDPLNASIGDTVTYCYNVTNTGDVTLTNVAVSDDIYGPVTLGTTTLAPGDSTLGTLTHVVTEADILSVTNIATVSATDPLGGIVTDDNDCTVNTEIDPGISVNKVANPIAGPPSIDVTFTITVANTGDCPLNPVKVVDTLPEEMSYISSSPAADSHDGTIMWNDITDGAGLVKGASKTIKLVAHIDEGAAGMLKNVVTATGTPPAGADVHDCDTAEIEVLAPTIEPPQQALIDVTTEIKSDGTVIEGEQFGWETGNGNLFNSPPLAPGEAVGGIKYNEKMIGSNGTTEFEKRFGVNTNVTPNIAVSKSIGYTSGDLGLLSHAEQAGMRYYGASPPLSSTTKCEEVNAYSKMVVTDVDAATETEVGITETDERDLHYGIDAEGNGSVSAGVDASVEDGHDADTPASRMMYEDKSEAYGNFTFSKEIGYTSNPP